MISSPVAQVFAREWPPLVATLMRDLGDLDWAEDAAQDAFLEAARSWTPDSTPDRPGAWLLTTARRKAIDRIRRNQRFDDRRAQIAAQLEVGPGLSPSSGDTQLAMIFGCCHRSLDQPSQIALTLRYVAGLSTAQIAHAFLVPEPTMAKRLVRAKAKIAAAGVPFSVPDNDHLGERLDSVLGVIYLIFTEGHTSANSTGLLRGDLCDEAYWLARHVGALVPDQPEPLGLAALIAFTDSRRKARVDAAGDLVLLDDQDRSLWNRDLIASGHSQLEAALLMAEPGPYQLQAAIAATHAEAPNSAETNWPQIVHLYRRLDGLQPSPVFKLNAAVAVALRGGREAINQGLALIDELHGELDDYRYFHAARADLLRRLGRNGETRDAYKKALALTDNEAERRFLLRRLNSIDAGCD